MGSASGSSSPNGPLVAEKHECAHIVMHLWPERVVPKCVADRSLAIAHRLEDAFWVEDLRDRWTKRTHIIRLCPSTNENSQTMRTTPGSSVNSVWNCAKSTPAPGSRPGQAFAGAGSAPAGPAASRSAAQ